MTGWNPELHRDCEALPNFTDSCLLGGLLEPVILARFDLRASQHSMAEEAVLAGAGAQSFILRLQIRTIAQMVHGIVARLLLIHRNDARPIAKQVE